MSNLQPTQSTDIDPSRGSLHTSDSAMVLHLCACARFLINIPLELITYCNFARPITAGAYNRDIDKQLVHNWLGHARLELPICS